MENFNLAPLVLLFVFILVPLLNYFLHRMGRRFEPPMPQRQPPPDMGFQRQAARSSGSGSTRESGRTLPPAEVVMPRINRESRSALFRSKRDMRRAIIAMTILGPCRANEPPD